jgi:hypothetical protein
MLKRLQTEILDKGAEACLPKNLTDEWLEHVSTLLERMLNGEDGEGYGICLAVVLHLLQTKLPLGESGDFSVSQDELFEYMKRYQIELALETVHRKTEIQYKQATLETILTDREVETWKV